MSDDAEGASQEAAARMQGAAADLADKTQEKGRQLYAQATDQLQQATGQFNDLVKSQPVVTVLAALAIGYVLGRLTD